MEAGRVLAGRRPDLTIREWLDANRSTIVELPYVLISSIDSCTDVGAMPWATARRAESPEWALSVSPRLYIGAGVSGAVHHRGGMQAAGTIVAVNNDPDAPIFEIADLGIVGDLFEVLPQAAAELRRLRG